MDPGKKLLLGVEGAGVLNLCYIIFFYRKVVQPLDIIGSGMDLLREQDFSSRLVKVEQTEADRIVEIFNRMMEQLKEERLQLREQRHFMNLLINASPLGVIILSGEGRVSQVNPTVLRMLNASSQEVIGNKLSRLESSLAAELVTLPPETSRTICLSDFNIYKCSHRSFIDKGYPHPLYLIEMVTDEVLRAKKKAYEKVIRMIVHEVNNTVAGITSSLDTVLSAMEEAEEMEDICDVMQVCMERCYKMSHFIVRFADMVKIPDPVLTWVDLNELARSCCRFMESSCLERGISLKTEFTADLPLVWMDASLFEQVLVNILKNAAESIGREGEIRVRTFLPLGMEVIDNGPSITREAEQKLFTPFFSTKPNGQEIGLILIREILKRHHCNFSLRTGSDGLTRFRISF
ncbi:MAG: ATP-binding protein [Bacteroides sp.]|nr:ATP-binding protein [Bacteroides sp.]